MSAHAGTHVDAPRHFFDDGAGTETLALDMLMGRARSRSRLPRARAVTADDLARRSTSPRTSGSSSRAANSRLWNDPAFHPEFIGIAESGARHLVERGVKLVGVDYLSVEEYHKAGAPAHHVLLGSGTIVIEGLNLRDVDPGIYDLFCLPLKVVGSDGAPARVVLRKS